MKTAAFAVWLLAVALPIPATFAQGQSSPSAASQPTTQPISDPELDRQLRALDARLTAIQDLSAHFQQAKHTPLLKVPLESQGQVRVKGQRTRWDTSSPHPSVLVTSEAELRLYYPQQALVEVYPLDECMGQMAASPMPRLTTLMQFFDIHRWQASADAPWPPQRFLLIELTPRDPWLRQQVQTVHVAIARDSGLAAMVEMVHADGESTTMQFSDVKLNKGLNDEDVELRTPPGTTISHPTQGSTEP